MYFEVKKQKLALVLALIAIFAFSACAWAAPARGGIFRFAVIDEAPTLDQQRITADLGTMIAQHIFEGLYTFNSRYEPVPMLVEGEEILEDGRVVLLTLREGVKFHNGRIMDAEDVLASLNRWGQFGIRGPVLFNNIETIEAVGTHQIKITFTQPFAPWKNLLAFLNGGPVIIPREIAEAAGEDFLTSDQYIGTGPYKFVERSIGRYIRLVRFDEYSSRTEPADGYFGERVAYFDELRFIPVPDAMTRVSGVRAGDFDFAEQIPGDLYDSLYEDPSVRIVVGQGASQIFVFFNSAEGIFKDNFELRQAILAAVDMEAAQHATFGPRDLWSMSGSFLPSTTPWYSQAGVERYSQGNPELARQLAEAAGYNGETIVFLASSSFQVHFDFSTVIVQQLRDAGFNVDFQTFDWATKLSRRSDPQQWDLFLTAHGFIPDPSLFTFMSETFPGWWRTETREALAREFSETIDPAQRVEVWGRIQALIYEEIPVMKSGFHYTYYIHAPNLEGIAESALIWPRFWGVGFRDE